MSMLPSGVGGESVFVSVPIMINGVYGGEPLSGQMAVIDEEVTSTKTSSPVVKLSMDQM